jgi:uncharacterized protein YfaS (alpha-2-macroglobulin family)
MVFKDERIMKSRRFLSFAVSLLVLNLGAILWIRHELLSRDTEETGPIRVVEAFPSSNVDKAERLAIVFNHDVGEPALLNEAAAEVVPFQFSPEVPGEWEWTSPRRLEFVLADPLPPGRTFTVTPTDGLESQLGRVVQVDAEIEFKTRPLELIDCRLVASDRSDVTFELKFNQNVSPDELVSHLTLHEGKSSRNEEDSETGRQLLVARSVVSEPDESIVLRCPRPQSNRLVVSLNEALSGTDGDRPLGTEVRKTLKIDPVFSFLRTEVRELSNGNWQIEVLFNSGLDPEQQIPEVSVSPALAGYSRKLTHSWRVGGQVLQLHGQFESRKRYQISVPANLVSEEGKPLGEAETISFRIPDRKPQVSVPDGRGILSQHGNLELELKTVNVSGVKVTASRVHANNLVAHLQGRSQRQTSRGLAEQVFEIPSSPNETITRILNLRKQLNDPCGVYRISAAATDRAWTRGTALVAVTDLGLTLKQSQRECSVWVTSLRNAQSVPDVRIAAYSYNNQQLAETTTDKHGYARLTVDPDHPDGRPWVVIAERGKQITWLKTGDNHAVLDDVDQSGRSHPEAFDVMLYSERGTYRPGETIHLTGIVRDADGGVPQSFPLSLDVIRPDGRTAKTLIVTPGERVTSLGSQTTDDPLLKSNGVFYTTFQTPEDAWTGTWTFRATLPGSDIVLGKSQAFVEEFLPVRLEVTASPTSELTTGETAPELSIESRYLFGQPAAGLSARVRTGYVATRFQSEDHPEFTFGPIALPGRRKSKETTVRLDGNGRNRMELERPPLNDFGRWRGTSSVTVTEDGGRSVSTQTSFIVDRSVCHIGLRLSAAGSDARTRTLFSKGTEATLKCVLRDAGDGDATFAPRTVELQRVEYDQVAQRVNQRVVWDSVERTTSIWKKTITEEVQSEIKFTCEDAGSFRIVATGESGVRTELEFQTATSAGDGLASRGNRPERLDIQLNKSKYKPGDTANATITSPFPGTAIVCLESNRVLWSQIVPLNGSSTTVAIEVPESIRGGAFVSATVVRPINPKDTKWLPHRARGIVRLKTDHAGKKLPVEIDVAASIDPKDEIPIEVSTKPGALVHLWAVDEGILATSGFTSPDPHVHFFAPRKNAVILSDVFSTLLSDYRRPAGLHRIGGDAAARTLRRNPVPAKKPKPVVVWNGFFKADSNGRVQTTAQMTQRFTGRLRWMAVGVDGDHYGAADRAVNVTQPLLVEASWPRYVSTGDSFSVPVKLINTTDQIIQLSPEFEVTGLAVTKPASVQFHTSIQPESTSIIWQDFKAQASGVASARLNLKAVFVDPTTAEITAEYKTADWCRLGYEASLSVRPVTTLRTDREIVSIDAGDEFAVKIDPAFMSGKRKTRLSFSSLPESDLVPPLENLLDYPYGCVEQTSSRLRALLASGHVLPPSRQKSVRPLAEAGISRLWSLQLQSGGLSYWPGQQEPFTWGTVYAAETLLAAKEGGYQIDDRMTSGMTKFLEKRLNEPNSETAGTRAAICCCLSRLGKPPTGWMAVLNEQLDDLDMAARAHLGRAWWHAGRRDLALAAIPSETIDMISKSSYGDRLGSAVSDQAALLMALIEMDADHEWVPVLVGRIQGARKNGVWLSTVENSLALESLAAWKKTQGDRKPFKGTITVAGQQIDLASGSSRELTLKHAGDSIVVGTTGSGIVTVCVQTTGLTADAPEDDDQLIQVRRRWLNRDGQGINPESIQVGDLVIVEATLKSSGRNTIPNIAIVDALPGGFEIENPRLRTSDQTLKSEPADHVQFQDDRVVLFATARPRDAIFRYVLRAVTAGSFAVPPIQASCMYNESISSIHGSGQRIQISQTRKDAGIIAVNPDETDSSRN